MRDGIFILLVFHPDSTSCFVACAPHGILGEGAPSGVWPFGILGMNALVFPCYLVRLVMTTIDTEGTWTVLIWGVSWPPCLACTHTVQMLITTVLYSIQLTKQIIQK
jgi:hypothetical protein